ncbi:hypothetical protein KJ359_000351 [Pestalotiopsis sp. 9143b]|nr:hypothetical protein KJ359_000351 [Pestalotiopsis sp. 9143b]
MKANTLLCLAGAVLHLSVANAADDSCSNVLVPSYSAPVVGSGWTAQLAVTNLTKPRGIIFDSNGHLLVVQQGVGVIGITFKNESTECLETAGSGSIINNSGLNHGIALSNDGKTLFASSSQFVYAWSYDPSSGTVTGEPRTIVQNLGGTDHTTRTLLVTSNNQLIVSRGSGENVDLRAQDISTGISQIKAFNMTTLPDTPYDYASAGTRLGWGLRNSVGVAQEPTTGGIFSVENSVDQISRDGTDVHQDNPGEELNFHGFLNGSTENQGGNYGYPDCFALWDTNIPDVGNMVVGSQFPPSQNTTLNDTTCNNDRVAPRLTFQAHMAPLDIIFTPDGNTAYVSFHGSYGCFRPVGLALDSQSRLFMTSDSTGEIYMLVEADMTATGGPTASGTLISPSSTSSGDAESAGHSIRARDSVGGVSFWGIWLTGVATVVGCGMLGHVA